MDMLCVTAAPSCSQGLPSSEQFISGAQPCLEEGEVLPCGLPWDSSQCLISAGAGEHFHCSAGAWI